MATPAEVAVGVDTGESAPGGIRIFRHAHRWLLIPLVITLLGFTPSYFLALDEASWQQHLHGLSAMLWFGLLIVQPYLATHGRLAQHRVLGPIGLLLAGMVVASALGVIPGNIENAHSTELPPLFPPAGLRRSGRALESPGRVMIMGQGKVVAVGVGQVGRKIFGAELLGLGGRGLSADA